MTYKEVLLFVGKCLTISYEIRNKKDIEITLQQNDIDWDAVVKLSTAQLVLPALYLNFKNTNLLKYLPEDLVAYMAHITNLNRERNTQIITQAHDIKTLLFTNNINPIFLKGTGNLLEGLYKDTGERMVGDIDFIVEKDYFLETVAILKDNGYVSKENINEAKHWHYPRLIHPKKIAAVEVHKKILKDDFQYSLGIDLFSDVQLVNKDFRVLSAQNKLLATTLPKIINDNLYHKKIITLRNAYDVFLISKLTKMDFTSIIEPKIHKKLNNYIGCMKIIFADNPSILIDENSFSEHYKDSFEKLLKKNKLEKKKVQFISYYTKTSDRFEILKKSLNHKVYRKYVLKRIFELDFYKRLIGIKKPY
ncbi:nucleotidyltransferase family protein [Polaribacter vadi]|uniref:nucleotidyltransferase family protein n=1 Tax=Polaribacter vadi TaxID=1774273 RepID=UPI0030EBB99B|tara:strand:- start:3643 stop:4731 length:1089 start_codon:yes stop_codon:yes gene_type:complete